MLDGMTNIKASEVLKEIKYYTEDLPPYSPDEVAEALEMAIKALDQRWIPVSEKLPEREGWYLTSLGDKTYGGADVDMYCKGWVKYGTHVLAWMPLPEPYKAESDKEVNANDRDIN